MGFRGGCPGWLGMPPIPLKHIGPGDAVCNTETGQMATAPSANPTPDFRVHGSLFSAFAPLRCPTDAALAFAKHIKWAQRACGHQPSAVMADGMAVMAPAWSVSDAGYPHGDTSGQYSIIQDKPCHQLLSYNIKPSVQIDVLPV